MSEERYRATVSVAVRNCFKSYIFMQHWGLSGRVSDSGARGRFETYRRRVVSLSKTLYSPKVLVNYPGSDGSVLKATSSCSIIAETSYIALLAHMPNLRIS